MKCEEFISLADRYLKESLDEEKMEAFEAHYFECDSCYTELKLRERLFSKEIPIVQKDTSPARFFLFNFGFKLKPAILLSSVLLVVVAIFTTYTLHQNHRNHMHDLYQVSSFDAPLYIEGETRDPLNLNNQRFSSAMRLYNEKQYEGALSILEKIDTCDINPKIRFFKGICRLMTDEPEAALPHFDAIISDMNPSYYDEAIYYKGIALLRMDRQEDALVQFQNLASMFSPFTAKAKEIIQKLRPQTTTKP